MDTCGTGMAAKKMRIQDPALGDAARRRGDYLKTLGRRLRDFHEATTRVDRGLAMMEAEVAAKLVESVTYEIAIRLLQNGVVGSDADVELAKALRPFKEAIAMHALSDGEIVRA